MKRGGTLTDDAMDMVCYEAASIVLSLLATDQLSDDMKMPMTTAIALLVGALAVPDDSDMTNEQVISAGKELIETYVMRRKEELERKRNESQ